MKTSNLKRILAGLLAIIMVLSVCAVAPMTANAEAVGNDGSAEMNEAYANKETLMPVNTSFNVATLLEWTPESDPDAPYNRASVKLVDREKGFTVNPLVNDEAKLMVCALFTPDNDHNSTQGTETFMSYAFNYWQYTSTYVNWAGSEEGIITLPTGEQIDAAHTNGTPIVATLGFPWGTGTGYVEQVEAFCQQAEDGSFPVADKLIEIMDYYGFDGYFFNQESYGCNAQTAARLNEMMRYMHRKCPEMLISWYDSMINTGGVSYGDGVNNYNKMWMEAAEDGVYGVDEFFMNYNWTDSKVNTTISTMESIGRSQFDAFAGINVQENCMGIDFRDHLLVDEDGMTRLSLALYCPNSTLGMSKDGEEFHQIERTFYTNAKADPRDTSVDLRTNNWAGMSRFFADHTVLLDAPFVTDFNSGHGHYFFVDGEVSRETEWSYWSPQDVMPTWTWIIDSEGEKLQGDYDFETAWNGGNSIKFYGDLTAGKANEIMLYSSKVNVENGMKLGLTYKGDQGLMKLVAYYGDANTTSYDACEKVEYTLATGDGWTTTETDLSASAGKILYAIGLKIESAEDVADYQVNLGRLTLTEKDRAALNGPSSVTLSEILYTDAYTAEARIYWQAVTGASSYEIYKVNADGSKSLIMETPNTAYYIPTLSRDASEEDVTLEIIAINRNGERGTAGTQLVIDWAYGNDDSDKIVEVEFDNVCLNATITGVSFENEGEPASKAFDGTSANNSKWCASNYSSGWLSIDLGQERTIRRWRVEHAQYGGEDVVCNTDTFALEYMDANGSWVEVKRISGNTLAVTDVLLDEPVTSRYWRLRVYNAGHSPWQAIRIYEWQMFETDQFPQTKPTPMQFASAINGTGATDTFTLKNVPSGQVVKVYSKTADVYTLIGETTSNGSTVVLENLDFGTADAGRVYYTTTALSSEESAKLSTPFEAESAEKSEAATNVEFVKFSQPGSVSSSNGADIFTTMTVNDLNPGDVVYVFENGADEPYTKVSLPVAEGATSVSISGVRVVRSGDELTLQVKRAGKLISDKYTVETPVFGEPTGTIRVFAYNENGESLTGVRFSVRNAAGEEVAQIGTTSDSGGTAEVELGNYTLDCVEVPMGYSPNKKDAAVNVVSEGREYTIRVDIPNYSDSAVTEVIVTPDDLATGAGETTAFQAEVNGVGDYNEEVVWSIEGHKSENTVISENGVLTIGEDETSRYVTVKATAVEDGVTCDYVDVLIASLVNVAPDAPVYAYYNGNTAQPTENGPENLFDGDLTTKWQDTVYGDAFVGVYLGENYTIHSVKVHHAGSAGEDSSLNTVRFSIMKDDPSDSWANDFWYYSYYSEAGLFLSQYYYAEDVAAYTDNSENITTFIPESELTVDGLYIKVYDPNRVDGSNELNIYEMEIIAMSIGDTLEIKREILRDLIAKAEGLDEEDYTDETWAVLAAELEEAKMYVDLETATEALLDEVIAELRAALDQLVEACKDHVYGEWYVTVEPTCTETGLERHDCQNCDFFETREIEALGHSFGEWYVTVEATCTEGGMEQHDCANCDFFETRETGVLEHNYVPTVTGATCTEGGYTTYTCSACGDSYVDDETEALGHDYESVVVEPTETEQGYTKHTCKVCGESYCDNYTDYVPEETEPEVTEPEETEPEETEPEVTEPEVTDPSVPETSKPAGENDSADTGDTFHAAWIFAMVLSLMGTAAMLVIGKKRFVK